MKKNQKKPSQQTKKRKKIINSHGFDVSEFGVLDIPVRREPGTGRLISMDKKATRRQTKSSK